MILDEILKCFDHLSASQRKCIAKEVIETKYFLAALVAAIVNHECPRLRTLIGFDVELHKVLMSIIAAHAISTNATKKKLEEIEEAVYSWLTSSGEVSVDLVYKLMSGR